MLGLAVRGAGRAQAPSPAPSGCCQVAVAGQTGAEQARGQTENWNVPMRLNKQLYKSYRMSVVCSLSLLSALQ